MIVNQGERYNYITATAGKKYAFVYTYTGREISIKLGFLEGKLVKCSWFDPRNGQKILIGKTANQGVKSFNPPDQEKAGNDWVLVIES